MTITETLNDRESKYGDFGQLAVAIQGMKSVFRATPAYNRMTAVQREAMEMIIVKQCRIWYGDPMHFDSWRDTAGYAALAVEEFHPRQDGTVMTPAANPKDPKDPMELLQALGQAAE